MVTLNQVLRCTHPLIISLWTIDVLPHTLFGVLPTVLLLLINAFFIEYGPSIFRFANNQWSNRSSMIGVNVKTLDSQVYSFRVRKNMSISQFKVKIASSSGIPVAQQLLIFRGRVLNNNHVLTHYHIEDGITLHLVERQPIQPEASAGANPEGTTNNADWGNDSSTGVSRGRGRQVSQTYVLGPFDIGDQGLEALPDINRIVGAVLSSILHGGQRPAGAASNVHNGLRFPIQSIRRPLEFSFPSSPISFPTNQMPIPDSLHTLSEFINRTELALSVNGNQPSPTRTSVRGAQGVNLPLNSRGFPTPEALTVVLRQAERLLSGNVVASLSHLAGRLEDEGSSNDAGTRNQIQGEAASVGLAMQHLGPLFLELGRTILTLHMGQSPDESLVNAGPALYISPSGPNPIMVQPFPLPTRSLFGESILQSGNLASRAPSRVSIATSIAAITMELRETASELRHLFSNIRRNAVNLRDIANTEDSTTDGGLSEGLLPSLFQEEAEQNNESHPVASQSSGVTTSISAVMETTSQLREMVQELRDMEENQVLAIIN